MTAYQTHPDWLALVAGICAEPQSDLRRLAAADWLDENGQGERAEFIRVGCELAACDRAAADNPDCRWVMATGPMRCGCARCLLFRRERELLLANVTAWLPRLANGRDTFEAILSPRWTFAGTPAVRFARGFVSAVTLTQAAFVGGPCGECERGYVNYGPDSHWCRACNRTGRTPGLAAALFAAHPVTAVTLTDRAPGHPTTGETSYRTGWFCGHPTSSHPEDLPQLLAPLLRAHPLRLADRDPDFVPDLPDIGWHWFASEADALKALSRACVDYGRSLVTFPLPPLPAPVDADAPAR